MPGTRALLSPAPGERGLASHEPAHVAQLLDPAWAGVARIAERVDLLAPSRLPGWNARDVLVHLGSWEDGDAVAARVAQARSEVVEQAEDADARNARLVATHHDATRTEILAALDRARRDTARYLRGPDAPQVGTRLVSSVVGDLPLTLAFAARAYELAVHCLDLAPAGAHEPAPEILVAGLAALADVAGALIARRGLAATYVIATPVAGWVVGVQGPDWTTSRLERGRSARSLGWPGIEGSAADVLDACAGRAALPRLLITRRLRAYDVAALLQLVPALEGVGGLGSEGAVRAAASWALAGAGRAVSEVRAHAPLRR